MKIVKQASMLALLFALFACGSLAMAQSNSTFNGGQDKKATKKKATTQTVTSPADAAAIKQAAYEAQLQAEEDALLAKETQHQEDLAVLQAQKLQGEMDRQGFKAIPGFTVTGDVAADRANYENAKALFKQNDPAGYNALMNQ